MLIILTGLPYCGKTTLARALEQTGAAVVELDHINRERGFRIEDGVPMTEWPETIRQAEARIEASDRHILSDEVLQRVRRRFQPPPEDSALIVDAVWSTQKQLDVVTAAR
ncbi:hypothetical protein [Kribbella kalugense]|uniref:hypothetical protein n=1 Tax=Kribbella kalugense TaxID=2512221 RepID=UPI00106520CA